MTESFLSFIDNWGYFAVALLMGMENACIPIPSELILGFAGYLVFAGRMTFTGALWAGMVGGLIGSVFAYEVGRRGGRRFVDRYGKYFLIKKSHVAMADRWFERYGMKAVFFSRMMPVIRTFISLPAGFSMVDRTKFVVLTVLGSLPWTALILWIGELLGEGWQIMMKIGHQVSIAFALVVLFAALLWWLRRKKH